MSQNLAKRFLGRKRAISEISAAANNGESSILVVYGRRRVGKRELIEHVLEERNLMKLERLKI
jgi:AAA+ ATPase superfamily predicted ATPase